MMKFEHKKIDITCDESGEFSAYVSGQIIRKPSLAAMKKAIDAAADTAFKPFDAWVDYGSRGEKKRRVTITGISRDKKRSYGPKIQYVSGVVCGHEPKRLHPAGRNRWWPRCRSSR